MEITAQLVFHQPEGRTLIPVTARDGGSIHDEDDCMLEQTNPWSCHSPSIFWAGYTILFVPMIFPG